MSFAIPVVGEKLETYRAFSFAGGLDLKTAPTVLANLKSNTRLTRATNVVYNTDGSVSKRWGMRDVCSASGLDGTTVIGGYRYRTSDGTIRDLINASTTVQKIETNGTLTSLKTALTSGNAPSFETYNDILHYANGVDAPQQYDGTTWAALGGSSPATTAVFRAHGNRLFATATAVKSRLYWCKLNNTLDWSGTTDAGFMDVNPNDGGIILPLVASNQELVILKENRPYRLQGIGPVTGFTVADNLVPAAGSVGAVSTRAAAFALNDVWYASRLGVHRLTTTQAFGDLTESFVSAPVEPYFRVGASTAAPPFLQAVSGYLPSMPMLHYDRSSNLIMTTGRVLSGSSNWDTILVYDLGQKAWAVWNFFGDVANVSAMWPAQNRTTLAEETWLGLRDTVATNAQVVALDRTATSDYGAARAQVAISAQVRHVSNLGAPGVEKTPRRLYLTFAKESATTTMTLNLYLDFKSTAAFTTTFDITSSTSETVVIKRIDLPSGLACEYMELDLTQATAGKTFTFYGYECQHRRRRPVRRAE